MNLFFIFLFYIIYVYFSHFFISYIIRRSFSPLFWELLAKMKMMAMQFSLQALLRCVPNSDNLNLVVETFPL